MTSSIFKQISPLLFAPVINTTPKQVIISPGNQDTVTVSGVVFERSTSASFYNDFEITGSNIDKLEVVQSSGGVVYEAPLLLREGGNISSNTRVKFTNGRGTTDNISFNFQTYNSSETVSNAKSLIPGSYADYSWNRVHAIFSQLTGGGPDNHRVLDSSGNRRHPSIFPHQSLTAQIMQRNHPYGAGEKRFVAITPRHVLGCGHYGWNANPPPVRFRDVNNNIIVRTCIRSYNLANGPEPKPGNGRFPRDIEIWLLDEDLPSSITPVPIVGDWFFNHTGSNTSYNILPGAFGFFSYNQDSHICPCQLVSRYTGAVHSSGFESFTLAGEEFTGFELYANPNAALDSTRSIYTYPAGVDLEGFENWNTYILNGIFYHPVRSGDSGSPIFFPVESGWALGGSMVAGSMWRPAGLNALIRTVDSLHGINTDYTVTVAPDPTLA
jgi:hypothetical protein